MIKTSVSNLLTEYFQNDAPTRQVIKKSPCQNTPVEATPITWEVHTDPERFSKIFVFTTRKRMTDFVNEVLMLEDKMNHHGLVKIVNNEVTVEVHTHTINRITNLDREYTQNIDFVYRDVLDFEYK